MKTDREQRSREVWRRCWQKPGDLPKRGFRGFPDTSSGARAPLTWFWCVRHAHTLTQIHAHANAGSRIVPQLFHENSRVQRKKVTGCERKTGDRRLQPPEGATRKSGKVEINRQLFFTTLRSLFLDSWMKWSALIFPQQKEALRSTEHTRLRLSDLISSCCSHKLSVTLFVAWLYR